MDNVFLSAYQRLYYFVAQKRIAQKDLAERHIHSHLVCVLSTGLLMWAYTLVSYLTIRSPIPAIVGLIASIIHTASPILYRFTNNRFLNMNIFLGAGIIHQAVFGFFCGGFSSNIIVWFGILPTLAGIICGRKGIITWLIICTFVTLGFLSLEINGFNYPNEISPTGFLISQALVTFGWIYTSAIVIWVFLVLVETHQREIETKREGIQNLLFVITHDISTPISIITGHSNILSKMDMPEKGMASVNKIMKATSNISNIVSSVKNLYATELGKSEILITPVNLSELLEQLKENFLDKLETKNIILEIQNQTKDLAINANKDLLLHQILGNLLSNAIKFSHVDGLIEILVEHHEGKVVISIKDSGIGIPKTVLPNLFDVSAQTNRPGTAGEKGTGFGLPIVKAYVEKLNGKISVDSITTEECSGIHGTTFILEFTA